MIKKTLYFGNPAYLRTENKQIIIEKQTENETAISLPIEDIGVLVLDHPQITVTQVLLSRLLDNNTAVITCDSTHHPAGILLNLNGNTLQSLHYREQMEASQPLKKQIWQQTVVAKIENQARVLEMVGSNPKYLDRLAGEVKSGDTDNCEAKAAAYYWKNIFPLTEGFYRDRLGPPPNNLLNYGYAILRATVARALVSSGLHPTFGVFHKNQYNAFCLADDMMEPYRPFVDKLVHQIYVADRGFELDQETKRSLLTIPVIDVKVDGQNSPLLNALSRTTASLVRMFQGQSRKMMFPEFPS